MGKNDDQGVKHLPRNMVEVNGIPIFEDEYEVVEDLGFREAWFGFYEENPLKSVGIHEGHIIKLEIHGESDLYEIRLESLPFLRYLNLWSNMAPVVPSSIQDLECLEEIRFNGCHCREFPPAFKFPPSLKVIDLSGNLFEFLPDFIGSNNRVENLHIGRMCLKEIPDWVPKCRNLKVFRCDYNDITGGLEILENFTNLTKLLIGHNKITSLPSRRCFPRSIRELSLCELEISEIPEWIGELTELRYLDLEYCPITTLPKSIGKLENLRRIDMQRCRLSSIPSDIGRCKELKEVWMDFNELVEIPSSFGLLTNLRVLAATHNRLTAIPEWIGTLVKLEELYLNDNKIRSIPPELADCTALKHITLCDNQITTLPPEMVRLPPNVWVELEGNPVFKYLVFIEEKFEVETITELFSYYNKLYDAARKESSSQDTQ
ncbi:MAG: leucine-rich repeat domain-containing protein [Candidatus Helarchaeota archaeon]|nr:leucine-rich repeat domain-containing protein [Candidatus Helarchaeota archaeon]